MVKVTMEVHFIWFQATNINLIWIYTIVSSLKMMLPKMEESYISMDLQNSIFMIHRWLEIKHSNLVELYYALYTNKFTYITLSSRTNKHMMEVFWHSLIMAVELYNLLKFFILFRLKIHCFWIIEQFLILSTMEVEVA